ncbi:acyl-CoA thioesterase [Arthrobacter sp. NPDC058130]|uniref:acyl-CoA thioesterase n=1 Tax=Arthrobacter sp. NPDC058130 TaxID=3346353 RepID=UPI0036E8902E
MQTVYSRSHHVSLGDTDSARVIYFAAVFRWHEQSFSQWLADRYVPLSQILDSGFALPVVSCSAAYPAPLRQDNVVLLQSWTTAVGTSSFTFGTTVVSNGAVAVSVETTHVWVERGSDGAFSSAAFPSVLRNALTSVNESSR